jgi:hypothetical protein
MASVLTGDLGQSFYYRTSVFELYWSRLPYSVMLQPPRWRFRSCSASRAASSPRWVGRFWDSAGKVFAARPVAAVLLGRAGADPGLSVSRLAAIVGLRHAAAPGLPAFALGWYFAASTCASPGRRCSRCWVRNMSSWPA